MALTSYKNDQKLKDSFIKEIIKHRKQDQLVKGTYGEENGQWRGCAVACSLRSLAIVKGEELVTKYDQHKRYETDLGIPEWLARLEDEIFENLPYDLAMKWPEQFAKAIPVGVNLEPVKWQFCAYLMKENIDRVLKLDIPDELKEEVVDAIRKVLAVHEKAMQTGRWSAARSAASAASAAWSAARSAASAAWSAARSAESAASAAWSAVSAAWSAESAARSAASAAWSAAWSAESAASAASVKHSKELLKLLKEAKSPVKKGK